MMFDRNPQKNKITKHLAEQVREFLESDDNSRMTPGTKQTITRHKTKKQKRLINDTMKNLHRKFVMEAGIRISYSSFLKMKPFWVVKPSVSDRETCLCKLCENVNLMMTKLAQLKVISCSKTPKDIADSLCCNRKRKECCFRECFDCKTRKMDAQSIERTDDLIFWWQWKNTTKEQPVNECGEAAQRMKLWVKEKCTGTVNELITQLDDLMQKKMCRHLFKIDHQYCAMHGLKEVLNPSEAIIQIDFAENWQCKYGSEIQAVHFGASHQQVTLHNVVMNTAEESKCFSTISDSRRHDAVAIWTYLQPVLQQLRNRFPSVDYIHIQSDGPTTQYRNKTNMFLLSTVPFAMGFTKVTWNFSEAGHGKGSVDGVGASLKRAADSIVSEGTDVPDAETFYSLLKKKGGLISLFYVAHKDIPSSQNTIPSSLKPVPGTMQMHQLFGDTSRHLSHRILSCYCSHPYYCNCYNPKTVTFPVIENTDLTHLNNDVVPQATVTKPTSNWTQTIPDVTSPLDAAMIITDSEVSSSNAASSVGPSGNTGHLSCGLLPVSPDDSDQIGQWCAVVYDNNIYPGIITECEDEIEVKTMQKVGTNRFVWPLQNDVIWYPLDKVLDIVQIDPMDWNNLCI